METEQLLKTLKIVITLAVIIGAMGAIFYLIYGFTILWQAMATGIVTGFLFILVFILLVLAIYFYLKMLLIRRDLAKCKEELEKIARKSDNSGHGELE
ncbi:MAG: hypothetical protein BWY74_00490 [Firmicutes bacterium ADurb.Bin419]|jgi:uncharacterized membrane protein|nr:MAG: hypothetical protein BWY74_00490 [Firmicutes bacterium ADurb.Bin419]